MDPRDPTPDEAEVLDFVASSGKQVEPLGPPSLFHNFGSGLGDATMQGLAKTGRAAAMALAAPVVFAEGQENFARRLRGAPETHAASDWYFENVVDTLASEAVDYWAPDAANVGAAGQTLNGLVSSLVPLAVGGGNPVPLLATVGLDTPTELVRQGAPVGTALGVGGIQTAATAVGFRLPAAWGTGLLSRLTTGAGSNLAIGAASRALSERTLAASGMDELAEQYGGDASAAVLDVGMGLAFGGLAHLQAPRRITKPEAAALLTANNAHHFRNGTTPGAALDSASDVGHVRALEEAVRQVLNGENVNVAAAIPEAGLAFAGRPRGEPLPSPGFDSAVARVLGDEGGFANDPADRGGATNFGISSRANPDIDVASLTREDAVALYRERYWEPIGGDRLPDDLQGVAFDAAVNQGVGWTRRALDEAGGDRAKFIAMREARYREIVANDPSQAKFLRGWLNRLGRYKETNPAGEALRERLVRDPEALARDYAAIEDTNGGTVLNTDLARELSPEYLANRTRSADVHEAASDTVKTLYETKLAQPTPVGFDPVVLFTAGGTGAGKTTAVNAAGDAFGKPEITYDTNMNTLSSAVEKVEQALASGRDVVIAYVYRDAVEALAGGAIPRAQRQAAKFGTGRTVPLAEHAKTHIGVRPVMEALAERYAGDDRVLIRAIDNSHGKGNSRMAELADLPRVEEDSLRERLSETLEEARAAGLDESLYQGFRAEGRPGNPQPASESLGAGDGGRTQPGDSGQVRPDAGPDLAAAHVTESLRQIDEGGILINPRDDYRVAKVGDDYLVSSLRSAGKQRMDRAGVETFLREKAEPYQPVEPGTPDAYAAAANDAIADTPDLLIVDDAGNVRPAAEVMAEVQAAAADAAVQAQAVATAVECALRSGT